MMDRAEEHWTNSFALATIELAAADRQDFGEGD